VGSRRNDVSVSALNAAICSSDHDDSRRPIAGGSGITASPC
jgi:hypothetical protein